MSESNEMQLSRTLEMNGDMIVKRVSVPIGLEELMEGLSKEIISKKPNDIYSFASEYFAKLMALRDESNIRVISGKSTQSVIKQMSRIRGNTAIWEQPKKTSIERTIKNKTNNRDKQQKLKINEENVTKSSPSPKIVANKKVLVSRTKTNRPVKKELTKKEQSDKDLSIKQPIKTLKKDDNVQIKKSTSTTSKFNTTKGVAENVNPHRRKKDAKESSKIFKQPFETKEKPTSMVLPIQKSIETTVKDLQVNNEKNTDVLKNITNDYVSDNLNPEIVACYTKHDEIHPDQDIKLLKTDHKLVGGNDINSTSHFGKEKIDDTENKSDVKVLNELDQNNTRNSQELQKESSVKSSSTSDEENNKMINRENIDYKTREMNFGPDSNIIGKSEQKYGMSEIVAVLKIQSLLRGYLVRKKLLTSKGVKNESSSSTSIISDGLNISKAKSFGERESERSETGNQNDGKKIENANKSQDDSINTTDKITDSTSNVSDDKQSEKQKIEKQQKPEDVNKSFSESDSNFNTNNQITDFSSGGIENNSSSDSDLISESISKVSEKSEQKIETENSNSQETEQQNVSDLKNEKNKNNNNISSDPIQISDNINLKGTEETQLQQENIQSINQEENNPKRVIKDSSNKESENIVDSSGIKQQENQSQICNQEKECDQKTSNNQDEHLNTINSKGENTNFIFGNISDTNRLDKNKAQDQLENTKNSVQENENKVKPEIIDSGTKERNQLTDYVDLINEYNTLSDNATNISDNHEGNGNLIEHTTNNFDDNFNKVSADKTENIKLVSTNMKALSEHENPIGNVEENLINTANQEGKDEVDFKNTTLDKVSTSTKHNLDVPYDNDHKYSSEKLENIRAADDKNEHDKDIKVDKPLIGTNLSDTSDFDTKNNTILTDNSTENKQTKNLKLEESNQTVAAVTKEIVPKLLPENNKNNNIAIEDANALDIIQEHAGEITTDVENNKHDLIYNLENNSEELQKIPIDLKETAMITHNAVEISSNKLTDNKEPEKISNVSAEIKESAKNVDNKISSEDEADTQITEQPSKMLIEAQELPINVSGSNKSSIKQEKQQQSSFDFDNSNSSETKNLLLSTQFEKNNDEKSTTHSNESSSSKQINNEKELQRNTIKPSSSVISEVDNKVTDSPNSSLKDYEKNDEGKDISTAEINNNEFGKNSPIVREANSKLEENTKNSPESSTTISVEQSLERDKNHQKDDQKFSDDKAKDNIKESSSVTSKINLSPTDVDSENAQKSTQKKEQQKIDNEKIDRNTSVDTINQLLNDQVTSNSEIQITSEVNDFPTASKLEQNNIESTNELTQNYVDKSSNHNKLESDKSVDVVGDPEELQECEKQEKNKSNSDKQNYVVSETNNSDLDKTLDSSSNLKDVLVKDGNEAKQIETEDHQKNNHIEDSSTILKTNDVQAEKINDYLSTAENKEHENEMEINESHNSKFKDDEKCQTDNDNNKSPEYEYKNSNKEIKDEKTNSGANDMKSNFDHDSHSLKDTNPTLEEEHSNGIILEADKTLFENENECKPEINNNENGKLDSNTQKELDHINKQIAAAIKIQSLFRSFIARKANIDNNKQSVKENNTDLTKQKLVKDGNSKIPISSKSKSQRLSRDENTFKKEIKRNKSTDSNYSSSKQNKIKRSNSSYENRKTHAGNNDNNKNIHDVAKSKNETKRPTVANEKKKKINQQISLDTAKTNHNEHKNKSIKRSSSVEKTKSFDGVPVENLTLKHIKNLQTESKLPTSSYSPNLIQKHSNKDTLDDSECVKLKDVLAAIKIQSFWKGYIARKQHNIKSNLKEVANEKVCTKTVVPLLESNSVLDHEKKKFEFNKTEEHSKVTFEKSVLKIQALWRGFKVRQHAKNDIFGKSVMPETCTEVLRDVNNSEKKVSSALTIQKAWRSYKIKKDMDDLDKKFSELNKDEINTKVKSQEKAITDHDLYRAASKIQAGVRGYIARKNIKRPGKLQSIDEESCVGKNDKNSAKNDLENRIKHNENVTDEDILKALCNLDNIVIPASPPEIHNKNKAKSNNQNEVSKVHKLARASSEEITNSKNVLNSIGKQTSLIELSGNNGKLLTKYNRYDQVNNKNQDLENKNGSGVENSDNSNFDINELRKEIKTATKDGLKKQNNTSEPLNKKGLSEKSKSVDDPVIGHENSILSTNQTKELNDLTNESSSENNNKSEKIVKNSSKNSIIGEDGDNNVLKNDDAASQETKKFDMNELRKEIKSSKSEEFDESINNTKNENNTKLLSENIVTAESSSEKVKNSIKASSDATFIDDNNIKNNKIDVDNSSKINDVKTTNETKKFDIDELRNEILSSKAEEIHKRMNDTENENNTKLLSENLATSESTPDNSKNSTKASSDVIIIDDNNSKNNTIDDDILKSNDVEATEESKKFDMNELRNEILSSKSEEIDDSRNNTKNQNNSKLISENNNSTEPPPENINNSNKTSSTVTIIDDNDTNDNEISDDKATQGTKKFDMNAVRKEILSSKSGSIDDPKNNTKNENNSENRTKEINDTTTEHFSKNVNNSTISSSPVTIMDDFDTKNTTTYDDTVSESNDVKATQETKKFDMNELRKEILSSKSEEINDFMNNTKNENISKHETKEIKTSESSSKNVNNSTKPTSTVTILDDTNTKNNTIDNDHVSESNDDKTTQGSKKFDMNELKKETLSSKSESTNDNTKNENKIKEIQDLTTASSSENINNSTKSSAVTIMDRFDTKNNTIDDDNISESNDFKAIQESKSFDINALRKEILSSKSDEIDDRKTNIKNEKNNKLLSENQTKEIEDLTTEFCPENINNSTKPSSTVTVINTIDNDNISENNDVKTTQESKKFDMNELRKEILSGKPESTDNPVNRIKSDEVMGSSTSSNSSSVVTIIDGSDIKNTSIDEDDNDDVVNVPKSNEVKSSQGIKEFNINELRKEINNSVNDNHLVEKKEVLKDEKSNANLLHTSEFHDNSSEIKQDLPMEEYDNNKSGGEDKGKKTTNSNDQSINYNSTLVQNEINSFNNNPMNEDNHQQKHVEEKTQENVIESNGVNEEDLVHQGCTISGRSNSNTLIQDAESKNGNQSENEKNLLNNKDVEAATKIQSAFRGYRVRRSINNKDVNKNSEVSTETQETVHPLLFNGTTEEIDTGKLPEKIHTQTEENITENIKNISIKHDNNSTNKNEERSSQNTSEKEMKILHNNKHNDDENKNNLIHSSEFHDIITEPLETTEKISTKPKSYSNEHSTVSNKEKKDQDENVNNLIKENGNNTVLLHTSEFHDDSSLSSKTEIYGMKQLDDSNNHHEVCDSNNTLLNSTKNKSAPEVKINKADNYNEDIIKKFVEQELNQQQSPKTSEEGVQTTNNSRNLIHTSELHDTITVPLLVSPSRSPVVDFENLNPHLSVADKTTSEDHQTLINYMVTQPAVNIKNNNSGHQKTEESVQITQIPISLRHSSEMHDTVVVPSSVTSISNPPAPGVNSNLLSQDVDGRRDGVQVALNEASAGTAVVISQSSTDVRQGNAQASNKDASTCAAQPDNGLPLFSSMESEKQDKSSPSKQNMEAEAATKIQAGFRGYQVRKQLKKNGTPVDTSIQKRTTRRKSSGRITDMNKAPSSKTSDIEEKSAVKIQAGIRGFLVRRRQKKQQPKE